jgi:ABC-2 type transport system permease protein
MLAVFLFGSIFIAIGAACSDFKDAQSMMMPSMLLIMLPVFTWPMVLRAPTSALPVALSLVPTATPFLMLPLTTIPPGPPVWQQALGLCLTAATTVPCVWAAGRIFRVGLLMQGKSGTLADMVRWVRA